MKKKSTATHAAMNNNRIHVDLEVELLVLQCERSWAYFMQLKGKREDRIAKSADQDELEGARIKHHAIKRLRRGMWMYDHEQTTSTRPSRAPCQLQISNNTTLNMLKQKR